MTVAIPTIAVFPEEKLTLDQKKRYDELTAERRSIVKDYYANDKVWVGPYIPKVPNKEVE